ncbi:NTF2 and RRM domain-containing protein [Paraphoma chrysanthemicola]|nr:NTF2 and RRM domain-containing protein [Paraphoma chrysanthemicola]
MATTESSGPVNGNYAPQAYENSYSTGASNFTPSQQPTASQPAQQAAAEVPKDEVGWYFVEQYYTTLSKSPDRLYLFYNKRSQYVSGVEEEKVNVCVGQKAINERIKDLDYKDTKVRVTNVDSQGSDSNIVIQVIGEISNKGQPHKRFAQTFVLAEQTNGYFVLNDIFRYLAEEPEDDEEIQNDSANGVHEPSHTAAVPESAAIDQSNENAASEEDLHKVDEKLEEVAQEEPAVEETAPAAPTEQVPEEIEAPQTEEVPAAVSEQTPKEETPAADTSADVEKPKEPAPTPTTSTPKAAPVAMPSGPPKPAAPRTWASLAASAHKVATPVVTAPASQQVPTQTKAAASAQPAAATPASQTQAPARDQSPATSQTEATGWQTATGHKKEQSRVQNQTPAIDADQKRAYIKNVYSQVEEGALRAALTKYGEIEYLDISRGKVS